MKKAVKLVTAMVVTLLIMAASCVPVMAENRPEESVVKVVWTYLTDAGVYADIKFGTSFLINENTVLTNYHNLVFINTDEKNYIIKYLILHYLCSCHSNTVQWYTTTSITGLCLWIP